MATRGSTHLTEGICDGSRGGRWLGIAAIALASGALAACSAPAGPSKTTSFSAAPTAERATPAARPASFKIGNPYQIAGRWFHPKEEPGYDQVGHASWYGDDFHGRQTANGETYDMHSLTAAHPTLPMPSYARVTNMENGRSVVVRINDRGPFAHGRLIDLSKQTARVLDFKRNGTAQVRVQYVGLASPQSADTWLTTTVSRSGDPVAPVHAAAPDAESGTAPAGHASAPPPQTPTLAWVSGYMPAGGGNLVADTFGLFDQ